MKIMLHWTQYKGSTRFFFYMNKLYKNIEAEKPWKSKNIIRIMLRLRCRRRKKFFSSQENFINVVPNFCILHISEIFTILIKKSVYWVAEWAQCTCELSSASDKWQYYCAPTPLDFLLVEVGDADNDCSYHIIGAHNLSSSSAWYSLSSILKGCWDWQSTVYLYSGFGQNHPPP